MAWTNFAIKDGAGATQQIKAFQNADLSFTFANGAPYPGDFDSSSWSYAAAAAGIVNTTAAVTIKAAAGSGISNYLASLQIMAEALANATELAVRDGAGGAVLWRTKITPSGLVGLSIDFVRPIKGTANTLMEVVTLTASGTGAVYVNAQGFVAP